MSTVRLRKCADRSSLNGRSPSTGIPSMLWTSSPGTDHVEEPRHDLDLDARPLRARAAAAASPRGGSVENAKIDAVDVELGDEVRQFLGSSEHRSDRRDVVVLARVRVDEADDVDAVLRMLEQLARDELADLAGADDRPRSG